MDQRELTHQWAHKVSSSGRASALSYEGPTLYSYGTEIARILGPALVAVNVDRYSTTTARHQSYTRAAIPHGWTVAKVDGIRTGGSIDARAADETARRTMDRLKAMQYRSEEEARADLANLEALATAGRALGSRRGYTRAGCVEAFAASLPWGECAARWKAARAKKAAQTRARNESARARYAAALEDWRAGREDRTPINPDGTEALRVKGENVETTKGARVPVQEARILWQAWTAGRDVRGAAVGLYRVTRQEPERLVIGCHIITRAEADALARAQSWTA